MHIPILETLERLCYRYPSALVDAVTDYEPGKRMVAVKNVTVNEDYFQGHFPGTPLLPAVLMIETLAQVATMLLVYQSNGIPEGRVYLRGVDNAKFRRQVVPGDRLRLEVTLGPRRSTLARAHGSPTSTTASWPRRSCCWGCCRMRDRRRSAASAPMPSAIVHPGAHIGAGTVIGPHAVIGEHVRIGRNCRIGASTVIDGNTEIGDENEIFRSPRSGSSRRT